MSISGHCTKPTAELSLGSGQRRHPFSLVDLQTRTVRYLRVSVTDRCNYRCTYCMPDAGVDPVDHSEVLSFAEIERLVRVFVGLGVRRVRLTGGEPLVRRGLPDLVARLAAIPGIEDLALTTNGHLLVDQAAALKAAGLDRLNVSLDTLDATRFTALTRRGNLSQVLAGLEAARTAGFKHTKLNAVVLRGLNDGEVTELADFAATEGYVLRFIEHMPFGGDGSWGPETFVAAADVRARLQQAYELWPEAASDAPGGGPATAWRGRRKDGLGPEVRLGFISAISESFCRSCNRVRLSSTGTLRECLSAGGVLSLRDMVRSGQADAEIAAAIRHSLAGKVSGHRFAAAVAALGPMSAIGG